jgi:hypothetical protein
MKDADLDALLARGALSGPARDRILDDVLARVSPTPAQRRTKLLMFTVLPAAAAFIAVIGGVSKLSGAKHADEFQARGGVAAARVEAACTGGTMLACPQGSRLVFHASSEVGPGYLAAYAQPIHGGERIWYFSAESESPRVGSGAVDRAVMLGAEHGAGRYKINVVVATRPLSRTEVLTGKASDIILSDSFDLVVSP